MGEDVYDLAEESLCRICGEPHGQCELGDMRYECIVCHEPIEYGEECLCEDIDHCAKHCPVNRVPRTMTVGAEPYSQLAFCVEWLSGSTEGVDGKSIEFSLTAGAGVGSPMLVLTVGEGPHRRREAIDIRDLAREWIDQVVKEIVAQAWLDEKENE
jgi:hypothetical protein